VHNRHGSSGGNAIALVHVQCPYCQSTDVVKYGKQANGTQRYRCDNADCARRIFLVQYQHQGRRPEIKRQIVDMTLNGSGVRDIVRVLRVSSATIIDVLKKKSRPYSWSTNASSRPWILRKLRSSSGRFRQLRSMECGAL
jgi:transposase-like protein